MYCEFNHIYRCTLYSTLIVVELTFRKTVYFVYFVYIIISRDHLQPTKILLVPQNYKIIFGITLKRIKKRSNKLIPKIKQNRSKAGKA